MPRKLRPRHPTTGRAFRPELGRFGNLPRELRDQIYSYVYGGWLIISTAISNVYPSATWHPYRMGSVVSIRSEFANDDDDSTRPRPKAIVDSLLVSRRFSEEVAHTLLATNQFIFQGPDVLKLFLDSIAEGHRHRITKVHLKCDSLPEFCYRVVWWKSARQALERLHGIKYLTVSSTMEERPAYHVPDGVRDRTVQIRESKLFPKLQLATLECYCGKNESEVLRMDGYLGQMQRFLAGDLKLLVGCSTLRTDSVMLKLILIFLTAK